MLRLKAEGNPYNPPPEEDCMRRMGWIAVVTLLSGLGRAQAPTVADYTKLAVQGDYVARDFKFHTGEKLAELHEHYASWGTPHRNAAGEIDNAILVLHGTMGAGINWGSAPKDAKVHPLLGPGGAIDSGEYYVIAPDTIGAGKSSKPSDGLRMKFPRYNLEDIVAAERLLVEHLGVKHVVAVVGASMGGRQTWQWGVQYPEFMDALVPMISSPFANTGRRGVIDFLPEAIIKADPAWKEGNYEKNPDGARLADLTYSIFLRTPTLLRDQLPTRDDTEKWVEGGRGSFGWPDANDFIYMMELRKTIGPDVTLRVDCNQAFTRNEAIRVLQALEPFDLELAEQPVAWHDLAGMGMVARNVRTPIMAHETLLDRFDALHLIEYGGAGVFGLKLDRPGGFVNVRRVNALAELNNIPCFMCSSIELGISTSAAAHL